MLTDPLCSTPLEKAKVRGVIDASVEVGVFVVHSYGMRCSCVAIWPNPPMWSTSVLTRLDVDDIRARMKVIFMGAPPFAVPPLRALSDVGAEIVGVFTKAPRAAGRRGLQNERTAVHEEAERLGLRVLTPLTLRSGEAQTA